MKTCLLCGAEAPDSAETCPKDGEASWSASRAAAPTVSDDVQSKAKRVKR